MCNTSFEYELSHLLQEGKITLQEYIEEKGRKRLQAEFRALSDHLV